LTARISRSSRKIKIWTLLHSMIDVMPHRLYCARYAKIAFKSSSDMLRNTHHGIADSVSAPHLSSSHGANEHRFVIIRDTTRIGRDICAGRGELVDVFSAGKTTCPAENNPSCRTEYRSTRSFPIFVKITPAGNGSTPSPSPISVTVPGYRVCRRRRRRSSAAACEKGGRNGSIIRRS
jgi:hypothetical protein